MDGEDLPVRCNGGLTRENKETHDNGISGHEKCPDTTALYLKEIGANALLSPEEERDLSHRAKQGDFEARQRMIRCNLRLVVKIARHYMNRGMDLLDLIEEGNLGLIHAFEKFEPERGFRFSTYATWWIRQNIERALMAQSRTIQLPVHIIKELNKYLREAREVERQTGSMAKPETIAARFSTTAEHVREILNADIGVTSLDSPIDAHQDLNIGETVVDEASIPADDLLQDAEMEALVRGCLAQLAPEHRAVLEQRFGLLGGAPCTLEEVAGSLHLNIMRVRKMQNEGLRKLRDLLKWRCLSKEDLL